MTPDELLAQADDPQLIPGIYNYCDRWCERCPMTAHCLLYKTTPPMDEPEEGEAFSEAFFEQMKDSFALAGQLLQKLADERGISLEMTPELEEAYRQEREREERLIKESPLTALSKKYFTSIHDWIKSSNEIFDAKSEELRKKAEMNLPHEDPLYESVLLKNAIEVISWYHMQIHTKITRAVSGKDDPPIEDDDGNEFPKDSDGSAKVALIGIDRSIVALGHLLDSFVDQETFLLDTLRILERLRQMIELTFPEARKFVRTGFED